MLVEPAKLLSLCFTAVFLGQSIASLLSQTQEYLIYETTYSLCPDSNKDIGNTGAANFSLYQRQHRLSHSIHKRLLDSGEVHRTTGHHTGILDSIYKYPLIVPSLAIQSGLSNLGDTRRLEQFINKLIAGEAVKIAALGGSVTVGHNVENKQMAWLYRVFGWINSTFPHPDHQFINAAIPAVTSAYVAPCVTDLLPSDLDLIFLEFSFNDGERSNSSSMIQPTRIGFERLLRKLVAMDSKPALLNFHYHPFKEKGWGEYWAGSEEDIESLLKYYGITSISFKAAVHRLLEGQSILIDKIWWWGDPVHPTCIGHRYIADLVIGLFQDLSAHMLSTSCCHTTHSSSQENFFDALPPPMLFSDSHTYVDKCYLNDNFKALENGKKGYEWINEGRKPGQKKFGFVSWRAGESLVVRVPMDELAPHLKDRKFLIALGVMESYTHMGYLSFVCQNGCTCAKRKVNSHNPSPYSLTYWKKSSGTAVLDEGSTSCELYIENIEKTRSGEHKTKISGLLLSTDIDSFIESWAEGDDD